MKLQQRKDGTFFLTIPKAMIRKKRWEAGKELVASFDQEGNIVVMPVS